jgi:hypothetical protein
MNDLKTKENAMKKVYIITAGTYSDYRVVAVFSSRKLAEDFMDAMPGCDRIEDYILNSSLPDLVRRGYKRWCVTMLRNGDVEVVRNVGVDPEDPPDSRHSILRRSQEPGGMPDCLLSWVWAKNKEQAVKIVNEHRAQLIATGQWE